MKSPTHSARIVVVGGGVTGLSTAYFLRERLPNAEIRLFEAETRFGGNIATEHRDGFVIDHGPDSFLRTKPQAEKLCRSLGIDGELIAPRPEARHVYIAHQGELLEMPAGMVLGIPTKLEPMLATPLLSLPAKLRMLGDVFLPRGFGKGAAADESIADFIGRRFGSEAAAAIAAPLLGGIYAGDVGRLSVAATFPQLVELERQYGSVILGLCAPSAGLAPAPADDFGQRVRAAKTVLGWLRRQEEAPPKSPFLSFPRGMGRLIDRLVEVLGPSVQAGAPVRSVVPLTGGGFRVELDGRAFEADAVVITVPAHVATRMLPEGALSNELDAIAYTSTATVFFAFERSRVSHDLSGSGFIVPPGEGDLIAGTWISSKWAGRAPEGYVLMRAFVGGVLGSELLKLGDSDLTTLARLELERLLGKLGEPLFVRVCRYEKKNPLPEVGHPERLGRLRRMTKEHPGLHLAGAAYDGVGIPDCVRQADAAAERIAAELGAS